MVDEPRKPGDGIKRCTAKNREGNPCQRYPILGGTVCATHGGRAPQVKRKARLQLMELLYPAIVQLGRLMIDGDTDAVKLRAVENVLDRVGVPRTANTGMTVEDARSALVDRLTALAEKMEGDSTELAGWLEDPKGEQ